jgi:hypothetical protein
MDENNIVSRTINFFIDNIDEIKNYYVHNNINELWESIIKISFINIENEASVLDWKRYLSQGDLARAGLNTVHDACWHYLTYGRKERRRTFKLNSNEPYVYDFDWKMYLNLNRDVFTLTEIETFAHWLENGYYNKRRTTNGTVKYKLNESIKISDNEKINNKWKYFILSIIQESNVTMDDLLYFNISNLLNNGISRYDFIRNKKNVNKLYYKLKLLSDLSLTFYNNKKNIIQVNTTKNNVNYIIEENINNIGLVEPTIFLYKNITGFMLFLDDVFICKISDYDNIQLNSNTNYYDLSINYPLSVQNFDATNWENFNYLLSIFPTMNRKYQLNICHSDPFNVNNIDHIIEKTNCNYIYVEKPNKFNFNLGYLRNLYKYLSLSDNIMFSDIDIPILNEILNDMVIKLNKENYQVVKPYINNIIYTNIEQKADWIKNYTFNYNNYKKFTSTLKNKSKKKLFTISGGIVVIKKNLLEKIGGFNEINGYGYEDRFMDVHLLNIPNLKIFKFENKLFHLYHYENRKDETTNLQQLKNNYNKRYYNCTFNKNAVTDLHQFCNHETKNLPLIEKFHQITNGDLNLFKKAGNMQNYITLKKLPF